MKSLKILIVSIILVTTLTLVPICTAMAVAPPDQLKFFAKAAGNCQISTFQPHSAISTSLSSTSAFEVSGTLSAYETTASDQPIDSYYIVTEGVTAQGKLEVQWGDSSLDVSIVGVPEQSGGFFVSDDFAWGSGTLGEIFCAGVLPGGFTGMSGPAPLSYTGTYITETGTYTITGDCNVFFMPNYSPGAPMSGLVNLLLPDMTTIMVSWSPTNVPMMFASGTLEAAAIFEHHVGICPSDSDTLFDVSGPVVVDQSSSTGISVQLTGFTDSTSLTITTIDFGNSQPPQTGISVAGTSTRFYDVQVLASGGGALGSGIDATVSITDSSFDSNSVMYYWDGGNWETATNQQFTAPHTLTGTIPASALTGTEIAVSGLGMFPLPEYGLGSLGAVLICFVALLSVLACKKRRFS